MSLVIAGDNLHRYVMLVAVLGFYVYNTSAVYPFDPFITVFRFHDHRTYS